MESKRYSASFVKYNDGDILSKNQLQRYDCL